MKIDNAKLIDDSIVDIEIENGLIKSLKKSNGKSANGGIDAAGKLLIPGLVDLHTHLREPGREDSETVKTGSEAAVAGGYTAISAMANTNPVADTAGVVEQIYRLGKDTNLCEVNPIGAVTKGLKGEQLAEIGAMADSIARVRIFSDDGNCVSDPLIMRRALEYVKTFNGIIAQHAQEPRLTVNAQMNEGSVSAKIGLTGWPAIAEEAIIARDILLTEHVQSRLHICHVTTAGGVELIRWAKARGIAVTAEVTPHHLLLTDDLVENYDPIYKVNPPLRTEKDVMALREGLAEGVIDIVATDHAPHPSEDKDCEWQAAAFGMVGLETALSVVIKTMIESKLMSWSDLVNRMSTRPAEIAGYKNQGKQIAEGVEANLVILDPALSWTVSRNELRSKSKNTPFNMMSLPGVITDVFYAGKQVFRKSS
ncbi:MAG: dihydroorotase [Actinobacteria bacterium]|nr:dihydroorotase [Actinomycetota bacterium]MSW08027.1 dihydroorotase [Actinomycetota bacterium]MSZ32248.1 dihydroorotase [Actinomycetota bacterium]MSZ42443.1 dihydroorotase [Actinomycetota bacterium]MSZ91917.1 dihydroorotase [Actinomycetota bacterium]